MPLRRRLTGSPRSSRPRLSDLRCLWVRSAVLDGSVLHDATPHARASHPAFVDRIAQRDIDEGAERAHITHRGEASQQGVLRVACTRQRLLGPVRASSSAYP